MSADFDVVVIGAGVIGLAVARAFALGGRSVLVLEKSARAGTETSSRNSEVIHAGIYYPQETMKARSCIRGKELLYAYCADHGIANKRLGKLIVATTPAEEAKLQTIHTSAVANGVCDLEWLTPQDVAKLEPEVACTRALLSPSTGIIDANAYMLAVQVDAENHGATFSFNTHFVGATQQNGFVVAATGDDGTKADVICTMIVNCAGHGAHAAAAAINGISIPSLPPRFLARGYYCSVAGKSPFQHLVYPVPVSGALGIHATLDMSGCVRLGPDIEWVSELDYSMPFGLPERFAEAVEPYWPAVRDRSLATSYLRHPS